MLPFCASQIDPLFTHIEPCPELQRIVRIDIASLLPLFAGGSCIYQEYTLESS